MNNSLLLSKDKDEEKQNVPKGFEKFLKKKTSSSSNNNPTSKETKGDPKKKEEPKAA